MKNVLRIFLGIMGIVALLLLGVGFYVWNTYGNLSIPSKSDALVTSNSFTLPKEFSGFAFTEFSDNVPNARTMAIAPRGVLIVAQPSGGTISALPDENGDGKADRVAIVAEGLERPHGLAFRCAKVEAPNDCDLYVAEQGALSVYKYDAETMRAHGRKKLLDLPTTKNPAAHKTRSLLFLPAPHENELLIALGSTCNVCEEKDSRHATILHYDVLTNKVENYATGLRNAVYMTLHPVTGAVWATEMGRDGLGDELPPDEVNIINAGGWYGWPWFYGKNVPDMTFRPDARPSFAQQPTESLVDIPAHSAPLGISFIPEEGWPEDYWYNALVAYHGSWNKSTPGGYKVVRMKFDARGVFAGEEDFITGWLTADGETIGRPADILVLSGGTLYVSDDQAGKVYKLSRTTGS